VTRWVTVAVVAFAGAGLAASVSATASGVTAASEWVLTKTEPNPARSAQPPGAKASARSGHIDYDILPAPQAEFDVDYSPPPPRVKPGAPIVFKVTAKGKLTGGTDTQGYRTATPILLVNDRWVGTALEIGQHCVDPIGTEPISCSPPVSESGSVTSNAPTGGTTFTIGIGMLNCGPCYVRYTYVLKEARATPEPRPKPAGPKLGVTVGRLRIDYEMPARFGLADPERPGLIQYHDAKGEIQPDAWRVDFTVRRKDGKSCAGTLSVTAPRAQRIGYGKRECEFFAVYPREGTYTVKAILDPSGFLSSSEKLEGTMRFPVQDWLIVGLGDSNGSGEGAPDATSRLFPFLRGKWQDRTCHRSAYSYQAQTALRLERQDRRTSVTFVHLACSGATIHNGILGRYRGIEPTAGQWLSPQVIQMQRLVGSREIDAVVVSIGVNDLKFGPLVKHCILRAGCPDAPFTTGGTQRKLRDEIPILLQRLPGSYARVAKALEARRVEPRRLYLSEYFDSTRDVTGEHCDPLISFGVVAFDRGEAQFAHDEVLVPLNAAVVKAADDNDWQPIRGAYKAFERHGYCVRDPEQRWIVQFSRSILQDRNAEGTLHATAFGNARQADAAYPLLRDDFYPNGPHGAPRPPAGS
jgi:hypothetical protein